jgi:nicotinamidase-related amidase
MKTTSNLRPDPQKAALLVVDIQEKLSAVMQPDVLDRVVRNTGILAAAATEFGFPILMTQQYTRGLGETLASVRESIGATPSVEKNTFSCCLEPNFQQVIEDSSAQDIILCGMETHVCVLQTAFDLMDGGYRVFAPADALCSRTKQNWQIGLNLMQHAGVVVGSTELFVFQMLREAGTERFKKLSRMMR